MTIEIISIDFDYLRSLPCAANHLYWSSIFILPRWLEVWWQCFGSASNYLCEIKESSQTIGIAPLLVSGSQARFIGSPDVCDYMDFIIAPNKETEFFTALLDDMKQKNIDHLQLDSLRYDSPTMKVLPNLARDQGHEVTTRLEDVSLDVELPATWDEYLYILQSKQRRELQRKLRRLYEAGVVRFISIGSKDDFFPVLDMFFKLLRESREAKALFMTPIMESFFRGIAITMSKDDLLRFGILELDGGSVNISV